LRAESDIVEDTYRTATEVVRAALAALEAGRWDEVVPFIRPDALQRHRDTQVRWLVDMEQRAPRTPEQLRAEQPWLPHEVAAFYAEQERTHVSGSLPALRAQWGVTSFRELEALSPAAFFVRYLSASTPAARIRAALAASHRPPEDVEGAIAAAEAGQRRGLVVLGEVAEAPDKAHVVYREWGGMGGTAFADGGEVHVTTLDHADGRWWLRMAPPVLDQQGWSFVWAPDAGNPAIVDG
jgi:hypothetical protein